MARRTDAQQVVTAVETVALAGVGCDQGGEGGQGGEGEGFDVDHFDCWLVGGWIGLFGRKIV